MNEVQRTAVEVLVRSRMFRGALDVMDQAGVEMADQVAVLMTCGINQDEAIDRVAERILATATWEV